MKHYEKKVAHPILKSLIQKSLEYESNKRASCPYIWAYQPHRPDAPLLKTPSIDKIDSKNS